MLILTIIIDFLAGLFNFWMILTVIAAIAVLIIVWELFKKLIKIPGKIKEEIRQKKSKEETHV